MEPSECRDVVLGSATRAILRVDDRVPDGESACQFGYYLLTGHFQTGHFQLTTFCRPDNITQTPSNRDNCAKDGFCLEALQPRSKARSWLGSSIASARAAS